MGSRSRKLPDAMTPQLRPVNNVPLQTELVRTHARGFVIAWVFALIFYFLEYAVRSSPSVMLPQLAISFGATALGVSSILVLYYYTYSITSLVAGAAGAAMIPYSTIKEVNPDNVKGTATGAMNFLVFGITAAIGPIFAQMIGKTLGTTDPIAHFRESGFFWMTCCIVAGMVSFLLRETGHAAVHPAVSN
jgi:hypothetical protein